MYAIKKINGLYRVVMASNDKILFSSAVRLNCKDFLRESLGVEAPASRKFRIEVDKRAGVFDVFEETVFKASFPTVSKAEKFISAQQ
jgi:hypothetical protein